MNLFLFLFLHRPQILTHGETRSHLVTPYLECITLPSIWTTRWSGTSLWDLYIWRASTRSKRATGRFRTTDTLVNTPQMLSQTSFLHIRVGDHMFPVASSPAACWQWHVGERRRSSRCVPHHPAALPLGRPGHQRLRAHGGQTQIPDGGTVRSVDSAARSPASCGSKPVTVSLNVSVLSSFSLFLGAHRQHEVHPSECDSSLGRPNGTSCSWVLH